MRAGTVVRAGTVAARRAGRANARPAGVGTLETMARWLAAVIVFAVGAVGCVNPPGPADPPDLSGRAPAGRSRRPAGTVPPATVPPATVDPPTSAAAGPVSAVCPLTGLAGGEADRPALAVKVENSRPARPQSGLGAADVVVEELVEGGITRFVAVYHSAAPATVGPVRSIRPMDPPIVAPLAGLFAYSGGVPPFVSLLRAGTNQDVGHGAVPAAYRRDPARRAPHNLYADPARLWAAADAAHRRPPGPLVAGPRPPGLPPAARPAGTVELRLSPAAHASWSWDASTRRWRRTSDGRVHLGADGGQLDADVVIVLRVAVRDSGARDVGGAAVPETIVVGSGAALIVAGGAVVDGRWVKAAPGDPWRFTDTSGAPLAVPAGRVWVELVPDTGAVSVR